MTPTATATVPPREEIKHPVHGLLTAMDGNIWTVNGVTFEVDGNTEIVGAPELGSQIDCQVLERAWQMPLALSCVVTASPQATPAPFEWRGRIAAQEGEWWTVGDYRVRVWSETQQINDPVMGDLVKVVARQESNGELWATSIEALRVKLVYPSGEIEEYTGDSITVDGVRMAIDGNTQIFGTPAVGKTATCEALQYPDGSLLAQIIDVDEPTATPTPVPTETPTSVPEPTATATETATVEPTATDL